MQSLNVTINIPSDLVVVPKKEYEELLIAVDKSPKWWTMEDLEEKLQRERKWIIKHLIKDNVIGQHIATMTLFPPPGGHYRFDAKRLNKFIDENFDLIKERLE
ncbi:DUF771 domain-containing protein [Macrococcoides caseolyticum]|uniref:DUF771 domain-containing protein n=1 Tax=Macrococcus caseolyticus (strain JCSC5402) TaxID=458233 RepID=B9E7T1_MACCJ|nr:DUF771 domain-containing protein [Macrococcus caseolyticus]BAH18249.1 conserved hypothetical protein [Macrococcus caseolyticus JCSC5402]